MTFCFMTHPMKRLVPMDNLALVDLRTGEWIGPVSRGLPSAHSNPRARNLLLGCYILQLFFFACLLEGIWLH